MTLILGIETSCDETSVAVVEDGDRVLSNVVASQIRKHAPYGGVVPELAAREHLKAMDPVVRQALKDAGINSLDEIDAIAATNGPGLIPALLVGVNYAKGLAAGNDLPFIGINHFIAHIYATFLDSGIEQLREPSLYPLLALVVSGGHTALVLITADGQATVVGTTIDDAAGEALDKASKLLGLGYPGGPVIEKTGANGDSSKYDFPRPLTGGAGKAVAEENKYNFSFSGIKTSLLYHCKRLGGEDIALSETEMFDTVASYQEAVIDVLVKKTLKAAKDFNAASIVLSGGVACNGVLRQRLEDCTPKRIKLFLAPRKYCTDNAAMVAGLAFHHLRKGMIDPLTTDAFARLPQISQVPFTD
ncbi:MAG: tRNA (adenosine(37)-N6)-threonylcarbamoyltransferase complex transferase subunit TsaD [Victivallales bacterium]|nr:tRNA (adenosine(37)-N6)-threonylcarbamoyltransferase complex transferase subunit TsaD [Victivallales bacterium]